jgi:hypothetical protein
VRPLSRVLMSALAVAVLASCRQRADTGASTGAAGASTGVTAAAATPPDSSTGGSSVDGGAGGVSATTRSGGAPATVARGGTVQGRCPTAGSSIALSLVADPLGAADTTAVVRLCLVAPAARGAIGSLRAVITYDSSAARVRGATSSGGTMAINSGRRGVVEMAGASTSGIAGGELASVVFRLERPGALIPMRLEVAELASVGGGSLLSGATVASLGPADCAAHAESSLRLTSMTPSSGAVGDITRVVLKGCGFGAVGNVIAFGRAQIRDVASTDGGTTLEFNVPTRIPSRGEVPPRMITAGTYDVTVTTPRGTSNALVFTLR